MCMLKKTKPLTSFLSLIFEPYDKKKGIVYTKNDSIIIPYSEVENGYYDYCLILREK